MRMKMGFGAELQRMIIEFRRRMNAGLLRRKRRCSFSEGSMSSRGVGRRRAMCSA
jgi:hypothetical protein